MRKVYSLDHYALNKQVLRDFPMLMEKLSNLENELFDYREYQAIADVWDHIIDTLIILELQLGDVKESVGLKGDNNE